MSRHVLDGTPLFLQLIYTYIIEKNIVFDNTPNLTATVGLVVFIVERIIAWNKHVFACNSLHQNQSNLLNGLGI